MGDQVADGDSVSATSARTSSTSASTSTNVSNASTGSRSGTRISQTSGARTEQRSNTRNQVNNSSVFKGNVTGMNSHVFQLHSERRKKGQFQETMDALKTLASTEFKQEIRYLEPLFRELTNPKVPLPIKPKPEAFPDPKDSTKTIMAVNPVKVDIYKEEIKAYVTKDERLKQAKSALLNIV